MQSTVHQTEVLQFFTLLQLSVIVVVARLAGKIAVRLSQARAVGEIVAGLMLGPYAVRDARLSGAHIAISHGKRALDALRSVVATSAGDAWISTSANTTRKGTATMKFDQTHGAQAGLAARRRARSVFADRTNHVANG